MGRYKKKDFTNFLERHLYSSIFIVVSFVIVCSFSPHETKKSIPSLIKSWSGYGGYCTDWAYARWQQAHPGEDLIVSGDAWQWYGYAQSHGMLTGSAPQFGAIAVWGSSVGGGSGHVAFVEQVYSGNSFRVSEMNWSCGRNCKDERDVKLTSDIHFIYSRSQQQITQCNEYDRCRGSGLNVYFIERGRKRLIPNSETLNNLNSRFAGDTKNVPDNQISKYPDGRRVPSSTWHFTTDYILVKSASSDWTYVMSSGVKRYLFSYDQLDPGDGDFYYPSDVRILSDNEFNSIPYGPALFWNGQLIGSTTSPEVYVMERNKRRLIPNYETLTARNYKPENIAHIPQEAINPIAVGRGVPSSTWDYTANNVIVSATSNNWTYVMDDGKKRYLFSYDQVNPKDGDFYYPSDVRILSDAEINAISTGIPMTWKDQMLRGQGSLDVYVIERDKKRHLPDLNTLLSRGLKPENIIDIPQGILEMFPTGRAVPDASLPNTADGMLLQETNSTKIWLIKNGQRQLLGSLDILDPVDGDFYYSSDIRLAASLQDIPIQPLDLPLSLSMSKIYWASLADYQAKQLSVDYIIKNTGKNDATEVVVTGSNNTKGVTTLSTLPVLVGDIAQGSQKIITIKYNVPNSTARFRASITATAKDPNEYVHIYP